MIQNHFCEILQSLHFADNTYDNKTDRGFKVRPHHLNKKFAEVLSNDVEQSINERMEKLKGRSGMKQYIKSKPIKRGFDFRFMCSSKTGYLYQMDTYLGRNFCLSKYTEFLPQNPDFNIGEEVVLQLTTAPS